MKERRVYQRSPIELAASFGIPEDDETTSSATVINISKEGFCFQTEQMLKVGTEVQLCLEIGPNKTAVVPVKVAWNKKIGDTGKYMIGVHITNASGPDFDAFLDFYTEHVKKVSKTM